MGEELGGLGELFASAAPAADAAAEAAAPAFETGLATIGGAGGGAGGLADFTGTGAGLFGGTTGLEGTALAGGFEGGLGDLIGHGAGGALGALGTAESFMGAPEASLFHSSAVTPGGSSVFGSTPGITPTVPASGSLSPNVANANAGASVFDTGTKPITGLGGTTGAPGGAGSPFSPPSGVTTPGTATLDPTSAAASAGTSGAGAGTGAAGSTGGFGDKLLGAVEKNPFGAAGLALSGAGLAKSALSSGAAPGVSDQLKGLISSTQAQAQKIANSTGPLDANTLQMLSYVNQGKLPPAMQAQVDNGVQAAKAAAASAMAAKGLPSDPANNAQLASQFQTIDSQALEMSGQLQTQLYQAGLQAWQTSNQTQQTALSATGLDLQTYGLLQSIYQKQSDQEQAAIGNLASALGRMGGGGGGGTTIKIGGS